MIDDEPHALKELEFHLKRYPELEICGMFINPVEALGQIRDLQPDCIFLDINMPMLNGIEFASRILDEQESVDIVFVTAYDEYAIKAFELHAFDYLLKPLEQKRFDKTIKYLIRKQNEQAVLSRKRETADRTLLIQCLGEFQIKWDGAEPIKWRTQKDRELFAFLLHNEGKVISKDKILDTLWTDSEPDAAASRLYSGIYYIRKTLQTYGVHKEKISISGKYCLNLKNVILDKALFEIYTAEQSSQTPHAIISLENKVELYTGQYFGDEGWSWAYPKRAELLDKYLSFLLNIAELYISNKNYQNAEISLLKAFQKAPYQKTITLRLLALYRITREKAKAAKHFSLYERLLSDELHISPESEIIELYKIVAKI